MIRVVPFGLLAVLVAALLAALVMTAPGAAFTGDRAGSSEIYVLNADGIGATNLSSNPPVDGGPDWQPLVAGPVATPLPTPTGPPTPEPTPTDPPTPEPTPTDLPTPGPTPTSTPPESPTCPPASVSGGVFSDALSAPLSIPNIDLITGAIDCISFSHPGTIGDLDVALDISHTWVGDLIVILTHDDSGTRVRLIDRPGSPALPSGCDGDDIDATLDDEASSPVHDECAGGAPTISGSFRPNEALSAFDGESVGGTWTIQVTDNAPRDVGALNGWSLIVSFLGTPTPVPTPGLVGDAGCDGAVNSIDATLILQLDAGLVASLACEQNADVNGDGSINTIDATLILQFDAGLIGSLPAG